MDTRSDKNELFALILFEHRLWGSVLVPYIIEREPGRGYYRLSECLSPYPNTDTLSTLNPEERELVKIINEYSDRALFKLYSREKTVKEFLEKITHEKLENFIRPYIERRLFRCFTISKDENVALYFRKKKAGTLHPEDRLILEEDNAEPVFKFIKGEEQSFYNLTLECSGEKIDLRKETIEIICNAPCIIRDDFRVIFVSQIEGSRLKPFLTKENIVIPKKSELNYFSSFVRNTINNFKVESNGFEIIESLPQKEAHLELGTGLNGKTGLILQFEYQGNKIFSNETAASFTLFEKIDDRFLFKKYHRDFNWEKECRKKLEDLGFFSDDEINYFPISKRKEEFYSIIEFVNNNYNEIIDSGFTLKSRLDNNYNLKPVDISISSEIINDWFDLKASVKIGEWIIPFNRFRKNIVEGIREYKLPDGSIAVLPETWFTKYKNIFEFGKASDDTLKVHKQHFSLLTDALSDEGRIGYERLQKLLIPEQIPILPNPKGLNCTMRQYQAEGLNWLNFLQTAGLGGCLADDMGLGKTIQTLALLQHNKENFELHYAGQKLTSLIIVPASLIYNWENEIKRFVPEIEVYSYKGNQRKKSTSYFPKYDIILSSYHTIRQDIDLISSFSFHYIILDESQVIKNPTSMLYRTVTALKSEFKLVLTGTPVENSLTDLWTQLNFVNPGLLGDLTFFRREFAKPIEKLGDDEKEIELRKIIKPFILRRTKENVATDLPPVSEQTVFCDMTE